MVFPKPFVVVWEGVDGAGKTTLMRTVARLLEERGYVVKTYKTPSDTPSGLFAKTHGNRPGVDHLTRMLLFLANTSDDSRLMIEEMKQGADFYFIDRYYSCSIVYGFAYAEVRGVEIGESEFKEFLELIEKIGRGVYVKPHLFVIVDAPEEERVKRLSMKEGQGGLESALERDVRVQEAVRKYYSLFQKLRGDRVIWVMNPEGMLEEVGERIAEEILLRSCARA